MPQHWCPQVRHVSFDRQLSLDVQLTTRYTERRHNYSQDQSRPSSRDDHGDKVHRELYRGASHAVNQSGEHVIDSLDILREPGKNTRHRRRIKPAIT